MQDLGGIKIGGLIYSLDETDLAIIHATQTGLPHTLKPYRQTGINYGTGDGADDHHAATHHHSAYLCGAQSL